MNWWQGVLMVVGLLVLRVGMPLAMMFLIGHLLRRLEAQWLGEN